MAEVGSLDSDMQALVYENYNKFITATDCIRNMAGSMAGMDAEATRLRDLMGEGGNSWLPAGRHGSNKAAPQEGLLEVRVKSDVSCSGAGARAPVHAYFTRAESHVRPDPCADKVEERSNEVNGKLQARQDVVEELTAVRALLRKLQVRSGPGQ